MMLTMWFKCDSVSLVECVYVRLTPLTLKYRMAGWTTSAHVPLSQLEKLEVRCVEGAELHWEEGDERSQEG